MDPSLESVTVEVYFLEQLVLNTYPQKRFKLCWLMFFSCIKDYAHQFLELRQAKEKSKGTWTEKPLCDLEADCRTEEDKQWLKEQVVASFDLKLIF